MADAEAQAMETMSIMAGNEVEVPKVVCPAGYRENFEKVNAFVNSSGSQNSLFGQQMLGEDAMKRIEEYQSAKLLEKLVGTVSSSEMEQFAAFTELPCTKAYQESMAKASEVQAALLGGEEGNAAEDGPALMMEMSEAIMALPQKAQQWLDKNLPGAKYENLKMPGM